MRQAGMGVPACTAHTAISLAAQNTPSHEGLLRAIF